MKLIADILGLLALVAACLAGIAGIGVLTAHRLNRRDAGVEGTGAQGTTERKNES